MTLRPETTYEYRFRDAYIYYCANHECLRVTDDHEDSVLLAGVSKKNINDFIECYFEYILDDTPMKEYFKERLSKIKEQEEIDRLTEEVS